MTDDTCNASYKITQNHNISSLRKLAGQKRKIRKGTQLSINPLRKTLYRKIVKQAKPIDNIVNLAGITLTEAQKSVLNKGLNFVQTPK